jgi:hypothetical protein
MKRTQHTLHFARLRSLRAGWLLSKTGCPNIATALFTPCDAPLTAQVEDGTHQRAGGGFGQVFLVNRLTPVGYPATLNSVSLRFADLQQIPTGTNITIQAGANPNSTEASDVNGTGLLFVPLPSRVRLLETRAGEAIGCDRPGAPLAAVSTRTQTARNFCALPATAQSVVGNATTVNPTAGYLTFFPSSVMMPPNVATSNFTTGQIINRHFIVGLGGDGKFKIYTSAQTNLVVDVSSYFAP